MIDTLRPLRYARDTLHLGALHPMVRYAKDVFLFGASIPAIHYHLTDSRASENVDALYILYHGLVAVTALNILPRTLRAIPRATKLVRNGVHNYAERRKRRMQSPYNRYPMARSR